MKTRTRIRNFEISHQVGDNTDTERIGSLLFIESYGPIQRRRLVRINELWISKNEHILHKSRKIRAYYRCIEKN